MRLTRVYRIWAGALPIEGVWWFREVAEGICDEMGGMRDGAFNRVRQQWALHDEHKVLLLPEDWEPIPSEEVRGHAKAP